MLRLSPFTVKPTATAQRSHRHGIHSVSPTFTGEPNGQLVNSQMTPLAPKNKTKLVRIRISRGRG
jgi:hypothetical protein